MNSPVECLDDTSLSFYLRIHRRSLKTESLSGTLAIHTTVRDNNNKLLSLYILVVSLHVRAC